MKRATKRLSYLRMAAEVQKIAQPLLHTGKYSMRVIYHHHILQTLPISLNTFRKMLKEDVSMLPELIESYRRKQLARYENELKKRRLKRLR